MTGAHVIIAVRGGPQAKTRCAARLRASEREALVEAMLEDMVTALRGAQSIEAIHVVTPTPAIAALARVIGVEAICEIDGAGLNAAFENAGRHIVRDAPEARRMLLPGDLPLIEAGEIDRALAAHHRDGLGIVPAHDGGTGALILPAGMSFRPQFGPASADAHRAAAIAAGITPQYIDMPSLAFDIDRPCDVDRLSTLDHPLRSALFVRGLHPSESRAA